MSCGRVRRELLDTVRFGELGPGSAPHLEHLAGCRACRDEVGFDRALVAQLRRALAARVDPVTPPPRAWYAILREAQRPEPRVSVWTWSAALVGRLRTATAMAGTGLALLLALNMEVIPVTAPSGGAPSADAEEATLQQVPRLPTGRTTLVALANMANEQGTRVATRPDPEQQLMQAGARVAPRPRVTESSQPVDDGSGAQLRLLVRPVRTPEHDPADAPAPAPNTSNLTDSPAEPVESEPGEPS